MSKRAFIPLPVSGPLNTSDPSTNRPPGTLTRAIDADTRSIGPRRGGKHQTWPGRLPTSLTIYVPGATPDFSFDGTNTYVKGTLPLEQKDLGNKWTLDVAFHAYAARTTANAVQIFQWKIDSTIVAIEVGVYGSTHATPNKVYAIIKVTSSAGVVTSTKTLVGGTVPFAGETTYVSGGALTRFFVRVVRTATAVTLIDSTGATATSAVVAYEPSTGAANETGAWYYGRDTSLGASTTFNGLIHRVLLRDVSASTTNLPPAIECVFPNTPSVRFFGTTGLFTNVHVQDHSSYGSHGLVSTPGSVTVNADRHYPLAKKVQGLGTFTDADGIKQSMVLAGGMRCYQRVR